MITLHRISNASIKIFLYKIKSETTSGVLWQGSGLLSVENSNFPCFSVSFTFQHEIRY